MYKFAAHIFAALCIITLAVFIGLPSLHGTFLNGDDQRFIIENALVNHPSWPNAWKLLTTIHSDMYQPIPMLSFQLNYALASPDPHGQFPISAYGFHLTNIILHAVNSFLVFLLARRMARCRRVGLLTAMLFTAHPYVTEPVGWICGRMILLGTTFALLTLIICLRGDFGTSIKSRWAAIVCWLFSLTSKVMPTVPLAAMFIERQSPIRNPQSAIRNRVTYVIMLILAAAFTIAAYSAAASTGLVERTEIELTTSAPVRILLASRYYLENFLWPVRLSAWNPPPENVPLSSIPVLIALGEWLAFGTLLLWTRRKARLSYVGLVVFLILLAPFLAATLARRGLTADRYMYLPAVGLYFAMAAACVQAMDFLRARSGWERPAILDLWLPLVQCSVLTACILFSRYLIAAWSTTIARDTRLAQVYPDHVDVRAELAKAYIFENQIDKSLTVIDEARKKWPDNPRLALQAGMAHRLKKDWPAAEVELARAAIGMPRNARTRYYYARTLEMTGKKPQARAEYEAILTLDRDYVPALLSLAQLSMSEGRTQEADTILQRIIVLAPYQRDALFELANLRIRQQNWPAAESLLRAILELDTEDRPAMLNLAVALINTGQSADAMKTYDRLLTVEPDALSPRLNRASLRASLHQSPAAESDYRAVLARYPDNHEAFIGLVQLLQTELRGSDLLKLLQEHGKRCCSASELTAWEVWALAINHQFEEARKLRDGLPAASPDRQFADWALAWDLLRRDLNGDILNILGPYQRTEKPVTIQLDYDRSVLEMLSGLPNATRQSPAGMYALSRALAHRNPNAAIKIAEQFAARAGMTSYKDAARELLHGLQHTPPQ
jgi:tetratricopeptide (TPR) repeat protein